MRQMYSRLDWKKKSENILNVFINSLGVESPSSTKQEIQQFYQVSISLDSPTLNSKEQGGKKCWKDIFIKKKKKKKNL